MTKFRQCNNPKPAHGGKNCSGAFVETKACKNDLCAGEISLFFILSDSLKLENWLESAALI